MDILKKKETLLVVGLVIGIIIGFFLSGFSSTNDAVARDNVKQFYELIAPGSEVEVVSVTKESGLLRVVSKVTIDGEDTFQESFVTIDGKLLSTLDSIVVLEESINQIEKSKNFVDCLYDANVRVYGVLNQDFNPQGAQATALQLNILSSTYAPKLYVNCDGESLQSCLQAGITEVPTVVIGNQGSVGIKNVEWFMEQTGCKIG